MRVPKVVSSSVLLSAVSKVAQSSNDEKKDPEKSEVKNSLQSSFTQVDEEFLEQFELDKGHKSMALDMSHLTGIDRTPSFHSECNSVHMQAELEVQKQEDICIVPERVAKLEVKKQSSWANAFTIGLMGVVLVSKKILAKKCFAAF